MLTFILTGFVDMTGQGPRKIKGIKAVKTLTGLGLKESKAVIDELDNDGSVAIQTHFGHFEALDVLDEGLLYYRRQNSEPRPATTSAEPPRPRQEVVRQTLVDMPRDLTVQQVLDVLWAVGEPHA